MSEPTSIIYPSKGSTENVGTDRNNLERPLFPRPLTFRSVLPAVGVALIALGLIPFANQTAAPVYSFFDAPLLKGFFHLAKLFVSPLSVVAFCIAAWTLRPNQRAAIVVMLIALGLTGVVNETLKLSTRRPRPPYTVLMEPNSKAARWVQKYVRTHPGTRYRAEARDQWLLTDPDDDFDDHLESFPSGHATGAFALAAFLIAFWPKGRYFWLTLAMACAVARIGLRRHFLEDVLFGGAGGWLTAQLVFSWNWPMRVARTIVEKITPTCDRIARALRSAVLRPKR